MTVTDPSKIIFDAEGRDSKDSKPYIDEKSREMKSGIIMRGIWKKPNV